jgi:hypothetical protein
VELGSDIRTMDRAGEAAITLKTIMHHLFSDEFIEPERFFYRLNKHRHTPHNCDELLGIGRTAPLKFASSASEIRLITEKLLGCTSGHDWPEEKSK